MRATVKRTNALLTGERVQELLQLEIPIFPHAKSYEIDIFHALACTSSQLGDLRNEDRQTQLAISEVGEAEGEGLPRK
jgi:hypothetical protein